jgi:4-amino-4-deoxy-L-arabinose transferase-like glycosyltransferase
MLARHDWVTPVLNGVPWLEKPIFYYWEAMLAYRVFGVSDWAARLPAAIDTTVLVAAVYWFMRRISSFFATEDTESNRLIGSSGHRAIGPSDHQDIGPSGHPVIGSSGHPVDEEKTADALLPQLPDYPIARLPDVAALDASLIFASCAFVVGFGHAGSTDAPLAASFGLAMLAWLSWAKGRSAKWLLGFYFFLGIGTLTKGPVAPLLAGLTIGAFAALRRGVKIVSQTLWWPGLLLYLVVVVPWYWLVQLRTGNFFQVFLWAHNVERFATPVFRHSRPFWFYLPIMLVALAPWTVLAVAAFVDAIRRSRNVPSLTTSQQTDQLPATKDRKTFSPADFNLFLVLWGVLPILFFSFSNSKLPGYILPALPPFAMLLALWLQRKRGSYQSIHPLLVPGHSLTAGATFAAVLLSPSLVLRLHPSTQAVSIAVMLGLAVLLIVLLAARRLRLSGLRFGTLLPVIFGLAFLLRLAAPALDPQLSARSTACDLLRLEPGRVPVAVAGFRRDMAYGLNFYLDRAVVRYEDGQVPAREHLLVVPASWPREVSLLPANRPATLLGTSVNAVAKYYWVGKHD